MKKTPNRTLRRVRRLVGGTISQPGDWPWIVLITAKGGGISSGVLIRPNWVLTTANSLYNSDGKVFNKDEIMIALGMFFIFIVFECQAIRDLLEEHLNFSSGLMCLFVDLF